jgi:hypothetical protein
MRARYKKRIPLKATVTFNNGERSAEGLVLDFTAPGCLIESPHKVAKGQYLGLQITLPGERSLFTVKLAAVRWTKGNHFGVEFIKMAKIDQHILDAFMAGQTH